MAQWLADQACVRVCVRFAGGQNVHRLTIFDIVNFCYKLLMEKTEGLFAVLVLCTASYASAENLECEESI